MAAPVLLAGWLLSMAWPLVKKVLVMLGIGFISYEGLSLIAVQIQGYVTSYWGMVGGSILDIATLGGIPQSIGIVVGAFNARLAFMTLSRLGKIAS